MNQWIVRKNHRLCGVLFQIHLHLLQLSCFYVALCPLWPIREVYKLWSEYLFNELWNSAFPTFFVSRMLCKIQCKNTERPALFIRKCKYNLKHQHKNRCGAVFSFFFLHLTQIRKKCIATEIELTALLQKWL